MFKTLLFVGFLAVALAAPSPDPAPAPAPAPAPVPSPGNAAVIAAPLTAPLGPALISNIGSPLLYSSYPAPLPLPLAGYAPSSPYIYKSYIL